MPAISAIDFGLSMKIRHAPTRPAGAGDARQERPA
jgi:hypothetical protein